MVRFNIRKHILKLFPSQQKKADFTEYFALYKKGAFREAYKVLRDIMENYPRYSKMGDMYVNCADLELLINDDVNKALEFLNKACELGCHFMDQYYKCYGYVIWRMGEHKKGIEYCEKSVELNPKGSGLLTLGTLLSTDNDKRAISIWKKVLEEDPKSCLAQIYLAREEYNSGNRDNALLMVQEVEKLNPTSRDYADIGRLYFVMEEFQLALDAYLKAEQLRDEPKGPIYAAIAACYSSMGEEGLAKKYIQWALQFNPENDYVQEIWKELKEDLNIEKQ